MDGSDGSAATDATGSARDAGSGEALGGSMTVAASVLTTEPSGAGRWWQGGAFGVGAVGASPAMWAMWPSAAQVSRHGKAGMTATMAASRQQQAVTRIRGMEES
jgi:hypothetical protein